MTPAGFEAAASAGLVEDVGETSFGLDLFFFLEREEGGTLSAFLRHFLENAIPDSWLGATTAYADIHGMSGNVGATTKGPMAANPEGVYLDWKGNGGES